jgi:hypothetical protein
MARKKSKQTTAMTFIGGPMDGSEVTLKLEESADITLQPSEVPASVMVLFRACTYRVNVDKKRLYHIPLK